MGPSMSPTVRTLPIGENTLIGKPPGATSFKLSLRQVLRRLSAVVVVRPNEDNCQKSIALIEPSTDTSRGAGRFLFFEQPLWRLLG
jgi:hypothetical protein